MSDDPGMSAIIGRDMDIAAFTAYLRDLADAVESGEAAVLRAEDGVAAPPEDAIEASLTLDYIVDRGREDLLHPIEVADGG